MEHFAIILSIFAALVSTVSFSVVMIMYRDVHVKPTSNKEPPTR